MRYFNHFNHQFRPLLTKSRNNSAYSVLSRLQDPSVQRAAGGTAPAAKANLDDYNPFDKTKAPTNGAGDSAAVMDTAPPQYTTSGQQQVSAADFQVRNHYMAHDCFGLY